MDIAHILNLHANRHVEEGVLGGVHDGQGVSLLEFTPLEALVVVQVEGESYCPAIGVLGLGAVAHETVTLFHLGQEAPVPVWWWLLVRWEKIPCWKLDFAV